MPHSPPTIGRTPFFLQAFSQYALRRYIVMLTPNTAQHHDQKDSYLSQMSYCPDAERSRNAAFRVSGIGARVDSSAAMRRRINQV